jgi:hypothetical protein
MNTKECDQDYVRADSLEAAVIQDVKTLFRDDAFVTRVWEETNRRLAAERPDVEKEIASAESRLPPSLRPIATSRRSRTVRSSPRYAGRRPRT